MKATIEIPEPPDGFEIIGPGPGQIGDMYMTAHGWKLATPGYFQAIRARRKKVGLVELLDTMQDCVERLVLGKVTKYAAAGTELRARLAAIDIQAAIQSAREIGQGGDK